MTTENLDQRAQQLLKILVEHYIRDGQPVGSKTIAAQTAIKISSATVRNVMAELEEQGYLHSPHKSAGRVPTTQGYRFFVNRLLTVKTVDAAALKTCQQHLQQNKDQNKLLKSVPKLLSHMTQLTGVVTTMPQARLIFRHIEFLSLTDNRVLVILVVNEQEVQNRVITTERPFSAGELDQAANFLTSLFVGKDLLSIREELLQQLRQDKAHMDGLMQAAITVAEQVFQDQTPKNKCVLAGETNLFELANEQGLERLRSLFDAFTKKHEVLKLLDKSLSAEGLQIFIGEESGVSTFDACSVVTAPYVAKDEVLGVLGVIGPTRMAYEQVIPLVDVTAKMLSSVLN